MTRPGMRVFRFACFCWLLAVALTTSGSASEVVDTKATQPAATPLMLDLAKSIQLALENSRRGKVSREDVEIALAQHGQALSSWWPHLSAKVLGTQLDQDPNFIFPASRVHLPASSLTLPSVTIPIPANSFGPGFPPVDIPLTTPPTTIDLPPQEIPLQSQDIRLMDRTTLAGSVTLVFPVYTGGLRSSRIEQAKFGIEAARHEGQRTDLEVIYDVKRVYYSILLARRLVQIGKDTLARMEATLQLTEGLYKTGSGTVKKTDYLRNKSVVETLRGVVAELESNQKTARAALIILIGLGWDRSIEVSQEEIPFTSKEYDSNALVQGAFLANPQIARVDAGISAARANVRAARSGYFPKVAFFGGVNALANDFSEGIVTPDNKFSWTFGVGVDVPIFEGFRVQNEEGEARARLRRLEHQMSLLKDAIALDVMRTCFQLVKAQQQQQSTQDAYSTATENRELNVRAYQDELVETRDVIQSQLVEALLAGQYHKVLYDHVEGQAKLDFVMGSKVTR